MLLAIQEKENLDNVKLVSMGLAQSQSSLIAGDVDAALLAGSLLIKTREAGGRILTTSEGYVTPRLVSASPRSFVEKHPDIIRRYNAVQQEAFEYIETYLPEALAIGAKAQDLSSADAADLFGRSGIANQFTSNDLSSLSQDIKFLFDLDMIEGSLDASSLIGETLSVQGE
jgi:ABC-type nitrate/sulfonate/bicarbonate transport system substrate-binding protein